MKKTKYINSIDWLKLSEDFSEETEKLMKEARSLKKSQRPAARRLIVSFAGAAIILTAGIFTLNYHNMFSENTPINTNINNDSTNTFTVATVKLPETSNSVKADMIALFVYQGRIYLHYNTSIETTDGYTVSKEDMLNLRGDYLGATTGGIDELSGKDAYKDFASNIGESTIYSVKGYDSKYRLLAYTEYEGGFSCEIYDSFGGLTLTNGADFFDLVHLKENIASYQWESFDSWNNGLNERKDAPVSDVFKEFLDALYTATPIEGSTDMLIENTSADSQKFVFLKTKDRLITSVRLLKDGYVYVPSVGFFQVDKTAFDAFYASMTE
jgi:hypothetical protein